MKKIGIIGGADPAASCLLYRRIIEICLSQGYCKNGGDFPEIMLINYPFGRGMRNFDASVTTSLVAQLDYCFDKCAAYGVDVVAIACNGLHTLLDAVSGAGLPLVHLAKIVVQRAEQQPLKKLMLFAAQRTIQKGLYERAGLELIVPEPQDQARVDRVIENIHTGVVSKADAQQMTEIAQKMYAKSQFDGILLGCTDFSVLHDMYPIQLQSIITLDSVTILADELVKTVFNN